MSGWAVALPPIVGTLLVIIILVSDSGPGMPAAVATRAAFHHGPLDGEVLRPQFDNDGREIGSYQFLSYAGVLHVYEHQGAGEYFWVRSVHCPLRARSSTG